jgi:hypothetical protein
MLLIAIVAAMLAFWVLTADLRRALSAASQI